MTNSAESLYVPLNVGKDKDYDKMAKVVLRDDGWFEAGKDDKATFSAAHEAYVAKQALKEKLQELGKRELDIVSLTKEIHNIEAPRPFKGTLQIRGGSVIVADTHGMPGEAFLGEIRA